MSIFAKDGACKKTDGDESSSGESSSSKPGVQGSSESDAEAGPSAAQRLFGRCQPKAKSQSQPAPAAQEAKAKAKAKAPKGGPGVQRSRPPAESSAPKMLSLVAASSAGLAAQSKAGGGDMLLVDGRAKRAFNTLQEKIEEYQLKLAGLALNDAIPEAHARGGWKQDLQKRAILCRSIAKGCKELVRRTEKSSNKESFGSALERLEQQANAAQSIDKLFSTSSAEQPDAQQMVQAYDSCVRCLSEVLKPNKALGPVFQLKYILAKGNLHCLYQEYAQFSRLFLWSGAEEMEALGKVLDRDDLQSHVVTEVENRVILALRAVQQQDLQVLAASGALEGGLLEASSLCSALIDCGKAEGDNFVPLVLLEELGAARGILTLGQNDLKDLLKTIDKLSAMQCHIESKEEEEAEGLGSAISRFFLQHATGKSLFDMACGRVEASKKEAEAEEAVKDFAKLVKNAGTADVNSQLLDQVFLPAVIQYQTAQKLCQELKKSANEKDKVLSSATECLRRSLESSREAFLQCVEDSSVKHLRTQFRPALRLACSYD